MTPYLLKIHTPSDTSFSYKEIDSLSMHPTLHYHQEIELIHIHRGSGKHFIGDSIKRFVAGDIIFVGSNVPHFLKYDEEMDVSKKDHYYTSIHFSEELWDRNFLMMAENVLLKNLIEKSKRGILLQGVTKSKIAKLTEQIRTVKNTYRLIYLLECLTIIAESQEYLYISS